MHGIRRKSRKSRSDVTVKTMVMSELLSLALFGLLDDRFSVRPHLIDSST